MYASSAHISFQKADTSDSEASAFSFIYKFNCKHWKESIALS